MELRAPHGACQLPCPVQQRPGVSWATRGRRGARPLIVANIATWWLVLGELEQLDGESWEEKLGMQEAWGGAGRPPQMRSPAQAGRSPQGLLLGLGEVGERPVDAS